MNRCVYSLCLVLLSLSAGLFSGIAAPIASGENQDGTITAGSNQVWTFTAAINDTLLARVGELSGGTPFSPRIRLLAPDGTVLKTDTDSVDVAVVHRATVAGTYTIEVSASSVSATGTYRVTFLKVPGTFVVPAGDDGGALTNGGNHTGSTTLGDLDAWTFTAAVNDSLILRVGEVSGGNVYYPQLRLYAPDGTLIRDENDNAEATVVHRATAAGTYTAVVSGYYYGNVGTYNLRFLKSPGAFIVPTGDEGGELASGQNYEGSIPVGDIDPWTTQASINETMVFRVGELSGGNTFYPQLRLYGPDGTLIKDENDNAESTIVHRATTAGTYTLVVSGYYYGNTGTYRLTSIKTSGAFIVPVGDEGGALTNGQNHDGTIPVGDIDPWSLTASINDTIVLRVGELSGGNTFYPQLRLYGPDGNLITDENANAEAEVVHRATQAGTYTVVVSGYYYGNTGTYRLRYLKTPSTFVVPAGDEGGSLVNGQNYDGTVNVGDLDPWSVTAAVNDTLIFRMGELSGGNNFYPQLRLYAPDGSLIRNENDNAEATIVHRATSAGVYTLVVSGYFYGNTGNYRLTSLKVPGGFVVPTGDEGGPLASGVSQDGVTYVGDLDTWVFGANSNASLSVTISELSGGNIYYPQIRLYNPSGALVSDQNSNTTTTINHTTTVAGIYTVVVSGYFYGNTGSYRLSMTGGTAIVPPAITAQPTAQAVAPGGTATFTVAASGTAPLVYQWRLNGADIAGATSATLTLTNVQAANLGTYSVVVSNAVGSATSANVSLTLTAAVAPTIVVQPTSQTTVAGTAVSFSVVASGTAPLVYQWRKDEVPINGATGATLTLNNPQSGDAGLYTVNITNSAGTIVSTGATLTVTPLIASRISNVSVRTTLAANQVLIVGLSMSGGSKSVLMRAVGPGLGAFGVPGTMPDPKLALFNGSTQVDANDNWGGGATLSAEFASVGAFALPAASLDAALTRPIEGGRTLQVSGSQAGNVIVEAYDLGSANTPRLINISARNQVGTGSDVMIAGFTIAGTGPKTVLIRAVGPTLAQFGVPGTLVDPKLEVYSGSTKINENDNWGASLAPTFGAVGAFGLTAGSKDAALLVTLQPGGYTVQVSGADGGTGEAIVEIYEVTP